MIQHIAQILETFAVLGTVASMSYYALCLWSAARFLRERKAAGGDPLPPQTELPVSILKPLKGTDPEMYESLRSHCLQEYPEYEIILGISDPADSARQLLT